MRKLMKDTFKQQLGVGRRSGKTLSIAVIFGRRLALLFIASLLMLPVSLHTQSPDTPIYLDPKQPIDVRVDDLMSRMTLKEKVGQLNLPCVYVDQLGKSIPEKTAACKRFTAGTYTDEIGPGAGFFT